MNQIELNLADLIRNGFKANGALILKSVMPLLQCHLTTNGNAALIKALPKLYMAFAYDSYPELHELINSEDVVKNLQGLKELLVDRLDEAFNTIWSGEQLLEYIALFCFAKSIWHFVN